MPYANVNSVDLYYELHGSGDPILLLAGLGSDAGTWSTLLPEFQKKYTLIILENRGSGRSSKPAGKYSTTTMAEDAVALLDHLQIEQAHVIGKSMGGMIAQILAARFPERIRSVVLASSVLKHDQYGEELLELGRIVAEKAGLYETYRLAFLLSYSKEYCMTHRGRLEEARRLLESVGPDLLQGYIGQSFACENHDSRELAKQIQCPALVIVGKEDGITTPDDSRAISAAIPKSKLVITPRGGHGVWREFPEDVNPVVWDFIESNED
jgi:pimeloyl-ACP methyl ester carboxylesterase